MAIKNGVRDTAQTATDVTAIKAVTDNLPDGGALTTIGTDTARLTAARAGALTDWINGGRLDLILDAILAEVTEIDEHLHNVARWWGATGAPDETNAIAATVTVPFVATSGNDTWGAAIPICGASDNPVLSGMTSFDPRRISVVDLDDDTTPWRFRIIYGNGTSAAAIAAEQWTEAMTITNAVPGNRAGGIPEEVKMIPLPVGTKLWAQVWNDTNGETLSFFWEAHGYPAPSFP